MGDHPLYDIEGAHRAGLRAIWLNRDGSDWPAAYAPAHAQITSLVELPAALARLPSAAHTDRQPMTNNSFDQVAHARIASLGLELTQYLHPATGARHFHLGCADPNNAFMVAFPTLPQDSTGVAHILEHTTLCGSRRYPVRDPFFMMLRRSLNTYMNAFTSTDSTAYPFATQNRKDFDNLLGVYLDAVFFPRLDPLDFAQEGWRLEFAEDGRALEYHGVVYNEMKGAMSAPLAQVWQVLHAACSRIPSTATTAVVTRWSSRSSPMPR